MTPLLGRLGFFTLKLTGLFLMLFCFVSKWQVSKKLQGFYLQRFSANKPSYG